jgi:hypothetical protein
LRLVAEHAVVAATSTSTSGTMIVRMQGGRLGESAQTATGVPGIFQPGIFQMRSRPVNRRRGKQDRARPMGKTLG